MLQGEHSEILATFIKLPFIIKIFVLSILSGCFTQVLLYKHLYLYYSSQYLCSRLWNKFLPPGNIRTIQTIYTGNIDTWSCNIEDLLLYLYYSSQYLCSRFSNKFLPPGNIRTIQTIYTGNIDTWSCNIEDLLIYLYYSSQYICSRFSNKFLPPGNIRTIQTIYTGNIDTWSCNIEDLYYSTCITSVNISVAGFVTSSSHLVTSEPSRPYTLGTLIPGPVI